MSDDPLSLDHLVDIAALSRVGRWPPAVGWWFVGAGFLTMLFAVATILLLRWQRNRYRREAMKQLAQIDPTNAHAVQQVNRLLKRVALTAYPREMVASLTGAAWLDFLAASSGKVLARRQLDSPLANRLADSAEEVSPKAIAPGDFHVLVKSAKRWIRHHVSQYASAPASHSSTASVKSAQAVRDEEPH